MSNLTKIIAGLESQRDRIDAAIRTLRDLGNNGSSGSSRNISAAGRRRIAEAQKRRWAKVRAQAAAAKK